MKYRSVHFSSIDSTNSYLKNHFNDLDSFTFVSSDYQSGGKGRGDRVWKSNEGENLLFSLLIKEKMYIDIGPVLSLVSAYSVSQVLEQDYQLSNVTIKWPNDIYVNDKKICGILLESRIPDYLIIGIGINVNQKDFVGEYRKKPTSLLIEKNEYVDINEIKKKIYETLIDNIVANVNSVDTCIHYFDSHNYLLNKRIRCSYENKVCTGVVIGVDNSFNLLVKTEEDVIAISSGEIELIQ